jgi:hypothetical protein
VVPTTTTSPTPLTKTLLFEAVYLIMHTDSLHIPINTELAEKRCATFLKLSSTMEIRK